MLQELRQEVCEANRGLPGSGLVTLTWGNVSGIDRGAGLMAIKPSGVAYEKLGADDIVLVDMEGEVAWGRLRPSSDTATHLWLYRNFGGIGGVTHTHSPAATALCQAGRDLPCLGTTHADHFCGAVPLARVLREDEVEDGYEHHTGVAIVERFAELGLDPVAVPGVLVRGHAPFTWGASATKSVENAIALEMCARMALDVWSIEPGAAGLPRHILDKHHERKHGAGAYYGQV
jgi:L-ribulose-5-phosphate 4-epimerase